MNTPRPPMEPLDEQEREFARILRALPRGEPPPALDAAILRAATNAAASSKQPVRRALASVGALWGIGSAAAAVLALGVAWQMRYGADTALRAERAPHAQAVSEPADDDSIQVELESKPAEAPFAAEPPPPAALADKQEAPAAAPARSLARKPAPMDAPAAAAPEAAPEPFGLDHLDEHVAREAAASAELAADSEARDRAASNAVELRQQAAAKTTTATAAAPAMQAAPAAPPPPPPPPASRADSSAGFAADAGLVGSVSAVGGQAEERKEELAKKPATWLAEIRQLRDQGHVEEARARLVEFHKTYPKWVIPTDLAPLLSE